MNRTTRSLLYSRAFRASTTCLLALFLFASTTPAYAARVFVDPGHGGPYPGAVAGGVKESYVNLLISLALRDALAERGHSVQMSRTSDVSPNLKDIPTWHYGASGVRYYADGLTGVYKYSASQAGSIPYDDLQSRCDMANKYGADIFISIHCDANTSSSPKGTATYRNYDNETDRVLSARLAELVQDGMMEATKPYYTMEDDGTRAAGFYVVRWTNMPAILIESAFLSNAYERSLLLDPTFRARLGNGIVDGVEAFLAEDPFAPRWDRLYGANRYGTAAALATDGWPDGAETVLLASGQSWPDALAATPLSAKLDAPLLLTETASLPEDTRRALETLAPSHIIVLGGERAVSTSATVQASAAASGAPVPVRRIAGADRYETSVRIAEEVGIADRRVMIASGLSYADALSGSARAGIEGTPIILTRETNLPQSVRQYLIDYDDDISRAYIIGGPAVVSKDLEGALENGSLGFRELDVDRLWGRDRYATNTAVLSAFWDSDEMDPYVATGKNYPDALAAGTLAAKNGQPIMLLGGRFMSGHTREFLVNEQARITGFTMVGGPAALPYVMDWEIEKGLGR